MVIYCVTCGREFEWERAESERGDEPCCPFCGEREDMEVMRECVSCKEHFLSDDMLVSGFCRKCAGMIIDRFYAAFDVDERALIIDEAQGECV